MAKKIIILNGTACRTLNEVRENWDIDTIYDRFVDSELLTWCQDRNYIQDDKLAELSQDDSDVRKKLCEIFEIGSVEGNSAKNIVSDVVSESSITPTNDENSVDTTNLIELADEAYKTGNYAEAVELLEKAAELGNPTAMSNIGYYYAELGDFRTAEKWYQKSVEFGDIQAVLEFGHFYMLQGKYLEANKFFTEAANNGEPNAMYELAMMYKDGVSGGDGKISKDRKKYLFWLQQAVDAGDNLAGLVAQMELEEYNNRGFFDRIFD